MTIIRRFRFCVSVVNHNEYLSGFLNMTNHIEEMSEWKISDTCMERLVSLSNNKKTATESAFYKKKSVIDERRKNLKKNSSRKTVPIYKPEKVIPI